MIVTKKFFIEYEGDMSIGLLPDVWIIEGNFQFDSNKDFHEFKEQLKATWEIIAEPVTVKAYEEQWRETVESLMFTTYGLEYNDWIMSIDYSFEPNAFVKWYGEKYDLFNIKTGR